jgi:hypothetical protein
MKRRAFIQQVGAGVAALGAAPAFARTITLPDYTIH